MNIAALRNQYHQQICDQIIRVKRKGNKEYPNFADGNSNSSVEIATNIVQELGCHPAYGSIQEQKVGNLFEDITRDYLEKAFTLLSHVRPGNWYYATDKTAISSFEQYEHLGIAEK